MSRTKRPKRCIAIDLGTGYLAIASNDGARCIAIHSPIDGSQVPTIVYVKNDKEYVGTDALLNSFNETGDALFMHAKRNLSSRPREKLYGGSYTPIDVLAIMLRYACELILAACPELKSARQFGGNKTPKEEVSLVLTIPATFGLEQQGCYEEAMKAAGFPHFDGFITEPVAAARRIAHLGRVELKEDDVILVVDVGAGTTDIAVLRYRSGIFDQVTAAGGDEYFAGHDFTNALAADIAKTFKVNWQSVYGKGGLNLSGVSAKRRPHVVACWNAAEDAKKKLSVNEEVTVCLDFPKGRKTHTIQRSKAEELWKPLFDRFTKCVVRSLDGTEMSFGDVNHIMLAGGSSRVYGLHDAMASAVGRDASDVHLCSDSEHIVAMGAAELGFFQDDAAQALQSGLGFVVFDKAAGTHRNLLMVEPGQVIPADGLLIERTGFQVQTHGGRQQLECRPFACRAGVRATVVEGRERFLEDSEILHLEKVDASLAGFPEGEHAVSLGVKVSPNRQPELLCRPTQLTNVEPLKIPLRLSQQDHKGRKQESLPPTDIMLLLDCSTSMEGEKILMLRRGARGFVETASKHDVWLGIVVFPASHDPYAYPEENAAALCELQQDIAPIYKAIDGLTAGGATPTPAALQIAQSRLGGKIDPIAVMFTDGQPNEPEETIEQANLLKKIPRLITVGIGHDVDELFLRSLATSADDYHFAECPAAILTAFENVAELIWSKEPTSLGPSARPSAATPKPTDSRQTSSKKETTGKSKPVNRASANAPTKASGTSSFDTDWDSIEPEEAL